jgi:hypothetical protein
MAQQNTYVTLSADGMPLDCSCKVCDLNAQLFSLDQMIDSKINFSPAKKGGLWLCR